MNHWSDQEILDHLQGLGPVDGHSEACAGCRARIGRARERAERLRAEPEISAAFLATQRRRIHERTTAARPRAWRAWAPAAVAASLLLVMVVNRSAERPAESLVASKDQQLYLEIYAAMQDDVPRAAQPIQGLFER